MGKGRLEAFSDAVIAIILTIMVLELKVPHSPELSAIAKLFPVFVSYLLSFIFIGIYWNNHHHLLHAIKCVNGSILWANMHLLFWLSLIPFATGWMGENGFAPVPVALYGVILFFASIAYLILTLALIKYNGRESVLANAVGNDLKGKISSAIYLFAILLAFVNEWIAYGLYVVVAIVWILPDRRIEKVIDA